MMVRATVRRLCALAVLTAIVVAPPPLLAASCTVPRQVAAILANITGSGTEGLCGTTSPVGAMIGFAVLSVWVYLVLVAALRAAALLGTRARIAGSARLLVLTNRFLGGGWVRRLVDVTIGIGMVAASGSGHLTPPSGTRPSAPLPAAPAHQASLTEQLAELLGLDDPAGLVPTTDGDQERPYVVQPGETLALIAERELGDADLWAWLFELNKGRLMPDGQRLDWPDDLRAGWVLVLPPRELGAPSTSTPEGAAPFTVPPSSMLNLPVPPTTSPQRVKHPGVSVELPSGSVVAFSLWLAMSTALLVALLRRRRSQMPSPPDPGICRYQPELASVAEQLAARARTAIEDPEAADASRPEASRPTDQGQLSMPPLADLTSENPALVPIGERDGKTVDLNLARVGALVLDGPDAVRVARAAVVTMLAQRGPLAAELLVVGDLLPGVSEFPGLRCPPDLSAALSLLQAEVIHRGRLLEAEELDDFAAYRRGHPDDPLPALVLLAGQVPVRETGRLEALVAPGQRLGIGALVIGAASNTGPGSSWTRLAGARVPHRPAWKRSYWERGCSP